MTKNQNIIRIQNTDEVKRYLFKKGCAVASEISEETNISMVTVHAILKELLLQNIVIEGEVVKKSVGRPATDYVFNYNHQTSLFLSVLWKSQREELQIIGEVVNLAGEVQGKVKRDLKKHTVEEFLQLFDEIYEQFSSVDSIGVMIPGKIHNGIVVSGWKEAFIGWAMEESLSERTGKPLFIQNDAHLITIGYCIEENIPMYEMVIGIYYPYSLKPGITILTQGKLIEGKDSLAGEGRYFPSIKEEKSNSDSQDKEIAHLLELLPFYNVALAPHRVVLSSDTQIKDDFLKSIKEADIFKNQKNQPLLEIIEDYFSMSRIGLQQLIYQDTPYAS